VEYDRRGSDRRKAMVMGYNTLIHALLIHECTTDARSDTTTVTYEIGVVVVVHLVLVVVSVPPKSQPNENWYIRNLRGIDPRNRN